MRPRSPIEILIDRATGFEPAEPVPERRWPIQCCCGLPFAARRACADERHIKTPCRCACHSKEERAFKAEFDKETPDAP